MMDGFFGNLRGINSFHKQKVAYYKSASYASINSGQISMTFGNLMILMERIKHTRKGPDKDVGKDAQYSLNHSTAV